MNEAAIIKFAPALIGWQKIHGRHDLPWQNTRDPYKVWLSEIMLQQTQVATVKDYFARFLAAHPTVSSLAAASLDEVLGLWSGLGYYSRARNMHRCAQDVVALHGGEFPKNAVALQTLPGIGPSTAAAIASLCFGERVAILDGNVKRVLTRLLGFDADLAKTANERALWRLATDILPIDDLWTAMPHYTQGVMDLGATLCTTRKPNCLLCPVQALCVASKEGPPERYPVKTRTLKRSSESLWLLWATREMGSEGEVYLEQRPTPGVWAGLYCLPVFDSFESLTAAVPQTESQRLQDGTVFKHVLTHKDLHLHPVSLAKADNGHLAIKGQWFDQKTWSKLGLPAPIRKLLESAG
ncbi:MAG: A/G-specific adenine glycosylase [Burkholderiaceae bacterium]|nr:A/G-specific adenine glycosylase [Burkholderiaceae bacterium]